MPTLNLAIDARKATAGAAQFNVASKRIQKGAAVASGAVRNLIGAFAAFTLLKSVTRAVVDFEQTMATVLGVTAATEREFAQLNETAKTLGATTRFTATEVGEGILFLARAGFTTTEVLEAVGDTLNLAAAGGLALGEAADFASNILSQFNLDASQTVDVVDSLIVVSNSANTNVRQLAEALKFAGPIAGALGLTLEETAASIGVLGNSGIQASLAGTNMRGVFSALIAPTGKAQKAIAALGLSQKQLSPQSNSLATIFDRLGKSSLGAEAALAIFGRRNAAAALILSANADAIKILTERQDLSTDAGKEMARIMNDTVAGAMRNLKSAVEGTFLAFGDSGFTGVLRKVVDFSTDVIRKIGGIEAALQSNATAVDIAVKAIEGLIAAFVTLIALKVSAFFGAIVFGVGKVIISLKALKIALLTNPFTALAVIITTVVGTLFAFRNALVSVGAEQATLGSIIAVVGVKIEEVFIALIKIIGEFVKSIFDSFNELGTGSFAVAFVSILRTIENSFIRIINFANVLARLPIKIPLQETNIFAVASDLSSGRNISSGINNAFVRRLADIKEKFDIFVEDIAREASIRDATIEAQRQKDRAFLQEGLVATNKISEELGKLLLFPDVPEASKGIQDLEKNLRSLETTIGETGDVFSETFLDIITGAKDATEALKALALELERIVLRELITEPLGTSIAGSLSGFTGSITNSLFGTPGANTTAAISNPQVVSGAMLTDIVPFAQKQIVNINITTPDASSFKQSQRQIINAARSILRK